VVHIEAGEEGEVKEAFASPATLFSKRNIINIKILSRVWVTIDGV
jgi:hypothetical protein